MNVQVLQVLLAALLAGMQQTWSILLLESAREQDVLAYLSLFDRDDVQDYIDGVGSSSGRQSIPMEERFWNRVGRKMPSKNFRTLFRCG